MRGGRKVSVLLKVTIGDEVGETGLTYQKDAPIIAWILQLRSNYLVRT